MLNKVIKADADFGSFFIHQLIIKKFVEKIVLASFNGGPFQKKFEFYCYRMQKLL